MATRAACHPSDRLIATLRSRIPGTTDALLGLEIVNVMDEFFRRTNAWKHHETIYLSEGETQYDIQPPENSTLVRVMTMVQNDQPIYPYDPTQGGGGSSATSGRGFIAADAIAADGDASYDPDRTVMTGMQSGSVLRYSIFFPQYVTVDVQPDVVAIRYPMEAILALSVNVNECTDCGSVDIPDWMWDTYFRAWLDGVQSSMMMQINKPYTNPIMAEYHGRRFRAAMAFHKQEAARGFVYNAPRWRFPRGGFITS